MTREQQEAEEQERQRKRREKWLAEKRAEGAEVITGGSEKPPTPGIRK